LYTGKFRSRNGVCVIVDKEFKKHIVYARRVNDLIPDLKFIMEQDTFIVNRAYALQVGLGEHLKVHF